MSAFHPDLDRLQRWLPHGVVRPWTLPLLRPLAHAMGAMMGRGFERVDVGDVTLYLRRPAQEREDGAALLWMHGGGLVFGDARQDVALLDQFVERLGIPVVSVQYRLAPRHPFPAGLDDGVAAFDWMTGAGGMSRIAVGGRSAGGHLAAGVCQRLRDEGRQAPIFQLLVYPMLDPASSEGAAVETHRVWDKRANRLGWTGYLRGHDANDPPPYAIPARTVDLAGLPPAWIGVGTLDLFHDEDVAYAERLRAAGVPVQLEIVPGAYHGFDAVDPAAEVSKRFVASQLEALEQAFV